VSTAVQPLTFNHNQARKGKESTMTTTMAFVPAAKMLRVLKTVVRYAERAAALQAPYLVPASTAEYLVANLHNTEVSGVNQKLCRIVDEAISADRLRTGLPRLVLVLREYRLQRAA
jgi:hypothetical protein